MATVFRPPIERITIDIEHKDYMQLAYKREIALQRHAVTRQRKWDTLGPRVKRELKGLRGWDPTPSKGCS